MKRFRASPPRVLAATAMALALFCPGSRADVAHLKNGRTLDVTGFRVDGDRIVLLIEGGGEMALPSQQVLSIQRSEPARPSSGPPRAGAGPDGERLVAPDSPSAPAPGQEADAVPLVVSAARVPDRSSLRSAATRIARKHGVDERLILAVIEVESRYDAFAVSPRGAIGLMQLMPETLVRFDVRNPYDPEQNIDAGVRYLKELLERYSGQRRLALAAYNAGEEAVERFSGIPPYRETVLYVDRVLRALTR